MSLEYLVLLSCARSLLESLKLPRRAEEKNKREVVGVASSWRVISSSGPDPNVLKKCLQGQKMPVD